MVIHTMHYHHLIGYQHIHLYLLPNQIQCSDMLQVQSYPRLRLNPHRSLEGLALASSAINQTFHAWTLVVIRP